MVFQWNLNDSNSPQVSSTLLSILADLDNAVVLMVSICPPISSFSYPLTKPLGIVSSALIIIGITVTFMFHGFFSSLVRFWIDDRRNDRRENRKQNTTLRRRAGLEKKNRKKKKKEQRKMQQTGRNKKKKKEKKEQISNGEEKREKKRKSPKRL